jgi:hypothetical protein
MTRDDTRRFAALAALAIGLSCLVGVVTGWPFWLWIMLCVLLLVLAGIFTRFLHDRQEQALLRRHYFEQETSAARAADETEPPQEHVVERLPLPSAETGYRFVFGCTVCWWRCSDATPHANPGRLAVTSIISRAREATARIAPEDYPLARHTVAAELGAVQSDELGQVEAWATDVSIVLSDGDIEHLSQRAELRRQAELEEQQRQRERAARAYLTDDVLRSPSTAVVWRLARHPDSVEETVRLIGALAQLSAIANENALPTRLWYLLPDEWGSSSSAEPPEFPLSESTADNLLLESTDREPTGISAPLVELSMQLINAVFSSEGRRQVFIEDFANLLDSHGQPEIADGVRARVHPADTKASLASGDSANAVERDNRR